MPVHGTQGLCRFVGYSWASADPDKPVLALGIKSRYSAHILIYIT